MQFRATHGNIHVHVQYSSREGGNNLFYKPFLKNIALSQIPALYGENTHSDFQNGNNGQIHALRLYISGPFDDTRFSPVSLSQFRNNVGINKIHHDKSTFANKVFCKGVGSKSISALSGHPNMSAILRCVAVIF